jgi:thiol-disulfide isomerase/thioredoxin
MTPEDEAEVRAPRAQFGPGRAGYSRRTRGFMALALGGAVVVVVIVAVVSALTTKTPATRHVTLPPEDRNASIALRAAARNVNFYPHQIAGAGKIEGQPIGGVTRAADSSLLAPGSSAPPFDLTTPEGKKLSLASLRGKTVLLELFATWCPHCAAEAPHLKALYGKLSPKRYAFVAVNGDGEGPASVLAYHLYFGLPFPALLDPSSKPGSFSDPGGSGPVSKAYELKAFPTFYVIDRHGKIAWSAVGEQPDALLLAELRNTAAT